MAYQRRGAHSRLVFWLKITLPVLAIVILSGLFLFARHIEFDGDVPLAGVDVNKLASDPRLKNPTFLTMTPKGAKVRIYATTARPGAQNGAPMIVEDVLADFVPQTGRKVSVTAKLGTYDANGGQLTLTGDVLVNTSDNYRLTAKKMIASFDRLDVVAQGPVVTQAPWGRIESGSMHLAGEETGDVLVFNSGVKLLYMPPK